ncbi:MAG TPA: peptidoglycan bridge formation glycyltransferase FemA/FemB family protein [Candidatus Omnitrophota bacterium]|nr:peptidoglycan bridge formation glycyltransferase FemA/FemB family protein [Candidatus Omnitrophota bacterium]
MELIELEKDRWDKAAAGLPGSQVLQSWEWGEVKRPQGWEPLRLAVEHQGRIVAQMLILKRPIPYIGKSLFYAPRGPLVEPGNGEALDFLLGTVKFQAKKHRAVALKIDPEIEETDRVGLDRFFARGFKPQKKQVQPRATYFLDLKHDLDTLLLNCEEKTRYNIRLAERKGVTVQEVSGTQGVDIFYDIYRETAGRDHFLIHPKSYYQKIWSAMGSSCMARIFVAYFKNEPIAAVVNFYFGKRVWYMYGASRSAHRNVMPNHALHWEIIKKAKEEGYELYDLWGIPSNPKEGHPLWGVYRFKKGFNGKLLKFIGCLDLVYDPAAYFLFDKALVWFKNMRSLVLKGKISDSLGE